MQNESFWNAKGLVLKISCSNVVWLTIVSYMSLTQQMQDEGVSKANYTD